MVGWPEYEVSNMGRVRRVGSGRVLQASPGITRYPRVRLSAPRRGQHTRYVHRLVAEAFIGPLGGELGLEVNHINGDKTDNRLVNLERVTALQNCCHAYAIGLRRPHSSNRGEINGSARLTEAEVRKTRRLIQGPMASAQIARQFGVSQSSVFNIKTGRSWSWLE